MNEDAKSAWIDVHDVHERPPEKETVVLVVNCRGWMGVGYLSTGYWFDTSDTELHDITHWQPLPAPPVRER